MVRVERRRRVVGMLECRYILDSGGWLSPKEGEQLWLPMTWVFLRSKCDVLCHFYLTTEASIRWWNIE